MSQFQVGVKAVILRDNKVLLLKRGSKYGRFEGVWDIPGGRINFGEEPVDGLKREVLEETGLVLQFVERPLDARTVFKDDKKQIVRITFLCRVNGGEVKLSHEHTEHGWFDLNNIDVELKDKDLEDVLKSLV